MWEKLEQIARRCAEIGELLTVPEIYGDAKELRRLTQEQKELEPVAQCYEDYRRAERTIRPSICWTREPPGRGWRKPSCAGAAAPGRSWSRS